MNVPPEKREARREKCCYIHVDGSDEGDIDGMVGGVTRQSAFLTRRARQRRSGW